MSRPRPNFCLPPRGLTAEETGWYLGLGTSGFKKVVMLAGIESEKKSALFDDLVHLIDRHGDMAWPISKGRGWTIESLLSVVCDLKPMGVFNFSPPECNRIERLSYLTEEELDRSLNSHAPDRDELCVPTFVCERGIFFRLADPFGLHAPLRAVG